MCACKKFARLTAGLITAVAAAFIFTTCNAQVGLGEQVDTAAPTVAISYPPAGSVIMDQFLLTGSCSDDMKVSAVSVSLLNTDTSTTYGPYSATVSGNTWSVNLNTENTDGTYPIPDGQKYTITATASDDADHSTSDMRAVSIDNTAPVLLLTAPTSYGTTYTPDSYGRNVTLVGDYVEDTNSVIAKMVVGVYNKSTGKKVTDLTFTNVDHMSANNKYIIAKYAKTKPAEGTDDYTLYKNYMAIYGDTSYGTSFPIYLTLTLTDSAKKYQDSSDSGVECGNTAYQYYLDTSSYESEFTLESAPYPMTITDIKNFLNGTNTTYTSASDKAAINTVLTSALSASAEVTDDSPLSTASASTMSINPKNNPTYLVTNCAISSDTSGNSSSYDTNGFFNYSNGSPLNITISSGADNIKVAYSDTENPVVVYAAQLSSFTSASEYTLAAESYTSATETAHTYVKVYSFDPSTTTNSTSRTVTATLASLPAGKQYMFVVTGSDANGNAIEADDSGPYVFTVKRTTDKPTVSIGDTVNNTNLSEGSIISGYTLAGYASDGTTALGSAYKFGFSGTAESYTDTLASTNPITCTVKVYSRPDSGSAVLITDSSAQPVVTIEPGQDSANLNTYNWTAAVSGTAPSTGNYRYEFTFTATDTANASTSMTRIIYVDNISPVLTVTNAELVSNATINETSSFFSSSTVNNTTTYTYSVRGKWSDVNGLGTSKLQYRQSTDNGSNWASWTDVDDVDSVTTSASWTANIVVTEGSNRGMQFRAIDEGGDTKTLDAVTGLTFDFSVPKISLDTMQNYTTSGYLQFSGTVYDSNQLASVVIGGSKGSAEQDITSWTTTTTQSDTTKTFVVKIPAESATEGVWAFTVTATDATGRTATENSLAVTIDVTNPVLSFDTGIPSSTYINKANAQKYTGTYTESTSGISGVYYKALLSTATAPTTYTSAGGWSSCSVANSGSTWNVSADLSGLTEAETTAENTYIIYFVAVDKAGLISDVKNFTQILDAVDPVVTISSPTSTTLSNKDVAISGTVTEQNLDSFIITASKDGATATTVKSYTGTDLTALSTGSAKDWSYTLSAATDHSNDGTWIFTVTAKDKASRTAIKTVSSIQIDTTSPVLGSGSVKSVTADNGIYYVKSENGANVTAAITETNSVTAYYQILTSETAPSFSASDTTGWTEANVSTSKNMTASLSFDDTSSYLNNIIYVYLAAADEAGNASGVVSVPVYADSAAPVFKIGSSTVTAVSYDVSASPAAISGTVTDTALSSVAIVLTSKPSGSSKTIDNVTKSMGADWSFTPLADATGTYVYTLTATDKAGRSTTLTVTVAVDLTAPELTLDSGVVTELAGGKVYDTSAYYSSSAKKYTYSGTWIDSDSGTNVLQYSTNYTGDASAAAWTQITAATSKTAAGTSWSVSLTLTEGSGQKIAFRAEDNAGNWTTPVSGKTYFSGITVDLAVPVASFETFSSATYNKEKIGNKVTVTGYVEDSYKAGAASDVTPYAYRGGTAVDLTHSSGATTWTNTSYGISITSASTSDTKLTVTYVLTIPASAADGVWTFGLTGVDAAGRSAALVSTSSSPVTIDTVLPVLTVTNATSDATNLITNKKIFETNNNYKLSGTTTCYTLRGTWSDATTGTGSLWYSTDGGSNWTEVTGLAQTTSSTSWSVDVAETEGSGRSIEVKAKDGAGNETAPAEGTTLFSGLTFDYEVPTVTLEDLSAYVKAKGTLTLTGSIEDSSALQTDAPYGVSVAATLNGGAETGFSTVVNTHTGTKTTFTTTLDAGSSQTYDGAWIFTVTATDAAGRTASAKSTTCVVDTKVPSVDGTVTVGTKTYGASTWYAGTSLNVSGSISEYVSYTSSSSHVGSGLKAIHYLVTADSTVPTDVSALTDTLSIGTTSTSSSYLTSFSSLAAGFVSGVNYLYIAPEDNAGNIGEIIKYSPINIDLGSPEVVCDQSGTVLVNGAQAVTFTGTYTDAASGVASVSLTPSGKTAITGTLNTTTGDTIYSGHWSVTIPVASLISGAVKVKATDVAGNSSEYTAFSLSLDTEAPTVAVTTPSTKLTGGKKTAAGNSTTVSENTVAVDSINGTVTFKGTASDNGQLASLALSYSTDNSTWTDIGSTTTASEMYNWSFSKSVNDLATGTGDSVGTGYLYLKLVVADTATNTSEMDYKYYIDRDTDRPVITLLSINNPSSGTAVLEKDELKCSIDDDDGVSSVKVIINSTNSAPTSSEWTSATAETISNGVFTHSIGLTDNTLYMFFQVVDTAGTTFTTAYTSSTPATADKFSRPYYEYADTSTKHDNSSSITFMKDTVFPGYGAAKIQIADANTTDAWTTAEAVTDQSVSASKFTGGDYKYIKVLLPVWDSNGIASVTATLKNSSGVETTFVDTGYRRLGTSLTSESTSATLTTGIATMYTTASTAASATTTIDGNTYYYWQTNILEDGSVTSGLKTLYFTITDNAGNASTVMYNFTVDNTGASITPSTPTSKTEEVSGSVSITGTTDDGSGSGVASIAWWIPTKTQVAEITAAADADAEAKSIWSTVDTTESAVLDGKKNSSSSNLLWTFDFDGSNNISFNDSTIAPETTSDTIDFTVAPYSTYVTAVSSTGSLCYIPVYFRVVDEVGNVTINRSYMLRYNPNGDKPSTTIIYPQTSGTETYITLGGSIRVNGSATDNVSVKYVYMQIDVDGDGDFDTDDYNALMKSTATEGTTDYYLYQNYGKAMYSSDTANGGSAITSGLGTATWWGIRMTGTASWYTTINKNSEFDPDSEEYNVIGLRACAIDNNGKVGEWSSAVTVHIDKNAPRVEDLSVVALTGTDANMLDRTVSKSQTYTPDMYLKGVWYLSATVYDTNLNTITVTDGDSNTVFYAADNDESYSNYYKTYSTTINSVAYSGYQIRVPITPESGSGEKTYTLKVTDTDNYSNTLSYSFNYDNTAPTVYDLTYSNSTYNVAKSKIRNSNYTFNFGSKVYDSKSGFDKVAFYFKRTITSGTNGTAGTYIYNPIPSGTSSAYSEKDATGYSTSSLAVAGDSDSTDTTGFYGVLLTGTRDAENTFTASTSGDVSNNTNIRAGGLIRIGGVYHRIAGVSGDVVTIEDSVDTSYTTAFFPYAIIIDNTATSENDSWSGTSYTMTGDDGDGVVETITKSGSTWTWDSNIMLDSIPDGPIDVECVAFDAAANITTSETYTMIANNTPRLSKVYLATDLSGEGTFAEGEFGTSTVTISKVDTTVSYYSALDSDGGTQEYVTLDSAKFNMRDKLAVIPEFVSGYEGGGDSIFYTIKAGSSAATAPVSAADGYGAKTYGPLAAISGTYTVSYTTPASIPGVVLTDDTVENAIVSASGAASYSASSYEDASGKFLTLTLWDNTAGTVTGTGDTGSDHAYTAYGSQYTVLNIPLVFDLLDSTAPAATIADLTNTSYVSSTTGHVEEAQYLPTGSFPAATTTGEYDRNAKISGEVVFTGTVSDNHRINTLKLKMNGGLNSEYLFNQVTVATYSGGSLTADSTYSETNYSTNHWYFAITSEKFSQSAGHVVEWKLVVDSAHIMNSSGTQIFAASDVVVTADAEDAGSNAAPSATKTVDIVPYITGITRSATTNSVVSKTYRSTYGEYPVALGDQLTVTGFNFADTSAATVKVGTTALTTTTSTDTTSGLYNSLTITTPGTMTFYVPANSGELTITENGIVNLNAKNNNAVSTNHDSTTSTYYDNCYLRIWDVNHYFSNSANGYKPTMVVDNTGTPISSWTLMGSASVQLQKGVTTTNEPIYVCYDQPDKINALSVDTKSPNDGAMSALYFPANVGSSGTPDSTGYADARTLGGAWGTGIPSDITSGYTKSVVSGHMRVQLTGNPYTDLDDKVYTAGWQLASYSMRREVSLFDVPRTVRYGDNMHFVYYDTQNKALRYTYQPYQSGVSQGVNDYRYVISGWTLIDGSSDGQDRVHTRGTYDYSSNLGDITYSGCTANYVTIGGTYADEIEKGDTIGISNQSSTGKYCFTLHTITDYTNNVARWTDSQDTTGVDGVTVYTGAVNSLTATKSGLASTTSAGAYIGIDTTTSGYPVIVYYDAANETLRIAYCDSKTPSMTTAPADVESGNGVWKRQYVTSGGSNVSGGTYVQCKIDGNNYLHILYRDSDGNLYYQVSTNTFNGSSSFTGYTFGTAKKVESSGTYGTLSLIRSGASGSYVYTPCVAFLNSEGTANGVKFAMLRTVDNGTSTANSAVSTASVWDTGVMPAVKSHYISGGELVYVEGYNGWSASTAALTGGVDTSACDAIVGYDTGRMDVLFLKSEQ